MASGLRRLEEYLLINGNRAQLYSVGTADRAFSSILKGFDLGDAGTPPAVCIGDVRNLAGYELIGVSDLLPYIPRKAF